MPTSLPPISANAAFFIDFDGTLVAIAPRPDQVHVESRVRHVLERLTERFDRAVAVITGRPLDAVDGFLAPLTLPVGAEHGSVRRDADGHIHFDTRSVEAVETVAARLAPLIEANPGLILERKQTSVALHYRQRPELGETCKDAVEKAVAGTNGLVILPGKMVFEVRPKGLDKGTAVKAFLDEPPFKGRVPVYIGDDVTDEDAFAAVNALGGITIKIDDGNTKAQYRIDRPGLIDWLESLASAR